jgi:hypothetical protein
VRLFLSYANEDAARVRQFSADLRRPGIEPWMDDELKLAGIWNEEIEDRIAQCDLFLLLLSQTTEAGESSRFFRQEWQLAQAGERRFLPVRLEECQLPPSLPKSLAAEIESREREDLFPSYEDGVRRILRFLHKEKQTGLFEETFSCLGPDNAAWRLGGWELDEADSTGENSRSIRATARLSPAQLLPQRASQTAAINIHLPPRPVLLRYRRRVRLSTPMGGEAGFRVLVDGELVDSASHPATEDQWTTRSVPIPDHGARQATLELNVTASGSMNYFSSAEAWVDDLRIA